jgi:hypothetical protein
VSGSWIEIREPPKKIKIKLECTSPPLSISLFC